MFKKKKSAKDVIMLIIDTMLENISRLPAKTKGVEKILEPVLHELKKQAESPCTNWDSVPYVVGAITYAFVLTLLYDCKNETPEWTCKDLLNDLLIKQRGRSYEWIARRVAKEIS